MTAGNARKSLLTTRRPCAFIRYETTPDPLKASIAPEGRTAPPGFSGSPAGTGPPLLGPFLPCHHS